MARCLLATALLLLGVAHLVRAWDCPGHSLTVQVAIELLERDMPNYGRDASNFFHNVVQQALAYDGLPFPYHGPNRGPYPTRIRKSMATMACLPDDVKSDTSGRFTNMYEWHFDDKCLIVKILRRDDKIHCPTADTGGQLDAVVPKLFSNLKNAARRGVFASTNPATLNQSALDLTYLLHLVGDAHQPLHSCTAFSWEFEKFYKNRVFNDSNPPNDMGGNNWCLRPVNSRSGRCSEQLHSFYDGIAGQQDELRDEADFKAQDGFGPDLALNDLDRVAQNWANEIAIPHQEATNLDVNTWFAQHVCTQTRQDHPSGRLLLPGKQLSEGYVAWAKTLLRRQVVLGGARLATMLRQIYDARAVTGDARTDL